MYTKNNGSGENNVIQNRFTALNTPPSDGHFDRTGQTA